MTYRAKVAVCSEIRAKQRKASTMQNFLMLNLVLGDSSNTVVKALCYKQEGRWFDPSWCH